MATRRKATWPALAFLLAAVAAAGESSRVTLVDGAILTGALARKAAPGSPVRIRLGTEEFEIPADLVASTDPEELPKPPAAAEHRLLLRDGGQVAGRIVEESDAEIRFRCGDRVIVFARADVVDVLRTADEAAAGRPGGRRGRFSLFRDAAATVAALEGPLQLSPEQKVGTLAAAEETVSRLAAARDAMTRGDRAAAAAGFRDALGAFRERMKAILTDVQFGKLASLLPAPAGRRDR